MKGYLKCVAAENPWGPSKWIVLYVDGRRIWAFWKKVLIFFLWHTFFFLLFITQSTGWEVGNILVSREH